MQAFKFVENNSEMFVIACATVGIRLVIQQPNLRRIFAIRLRILCKNKSRSMHATMCEEDIDRWCYEPFVYGVNMHRVIRHHP